MSGRREGILFDERGTGAHEDCRSNAGNARILGMDDDLELTGNRFNIAMTAFLSQLHCPGGVSLHLVIGCSDYLLIPRRPANMLCNANMLCKKFGPKIWLSFLSFGFGIITMCTAFVTSYPGFVIARLALGELEAGIMWGIMFTLSQL